MTDLLTQLLWLTLALLLFGVLCWLVYAHGYQSGYADGRLDQQEQDHARATKMRRTFWQGQN